MIECGIIATMPVRFRLSPHFTILMRFAGAMFITLYMLLIGGSFDASVRFQVQLLNALGALLLGGVWLNIRTRQNTTLQLTGLELPVILFVLSQWVAGGASSFARLALEPAVNATAWALVFIIFTDMLNAGWPRQQWLNALLLAALVITAHGLWEFGAWLARWLALGEFPWVAYRVTGLLGHANLTAAALNLLWPLVWVRSQASGGLTRWALRGLLLGVFITLFLTSSRGGWLAGWFTALLYLGLTRPLPSLWGAWKNLSLKFKTTLMFISLIWLISGTGLVAFQLNHATHGALLSSRQPFWQPAWELFLFRPLAGVGPELFAWFYPTFYSIPPDWFAPHAHSLPLQLLSGSGLLGGVAGLWLVIQAVRLVRRRWENDSAQRGLLAALIAGLCGFMAHQGFDYFFGTPTMIFLFVLVSALLFAPPQPTPTRAKPNWLALPLVLVTALTGFYLYGAALNAQGLQLAAQNRWAEAARVFEAAAQFDPSFPLYTTEAAHAYTRVGEIDRALPLWRRSVDLDPAWAAPALNLAVLTHDQTVMTNALEHAGRSDLIALNAALNAEQLGDEARARYFFERALEFNPALSQALFWQQTPLRRALVQNLSTPASALSQGEAALQTGDFAQAQTWFEQARAEAPLTHAPYVGLARAAQGLGDLARAERYWRISQLLPASSLAQSLPSIELEGDLAVARGDRATALHAYGLAFSAINDFGLQGPGTYGYPQRDLIVFRRSALPSDLVLQVQHALLTPDLDQRLAQLARWYIEAGQLETGCFILGRLNREAPESESGALARQQCAP